MIVTAVGIATDPRRMAKWIMALTWKIAHPEHLVLATVEGNVKYGEVEAFVAALSAAGAIPYGKLFDVRRGAAELSEGDLMSYADMAAGYESTAPLGPLALVIDAQAAPADVVLRRLAVIPRPFRIFYDPDEARRWLIQQLA